MHVPSLFILTPLLITLLLPTLQGKAGAITVLVVSASGTLVANTDVHFRVEHESQSRGMCTTDAQGGCVLAIADAPTDASGLVRGNLYVGESSRPVIWPGGDLAITITLTKSGLIRPGADFINGAPLTPTVTRTPTTRAAIVASPHVGTMITPVPTTSPVTRSLTPTSTPPAAAHPLPDTPPTSHALMSWQWLGGILVIALLGGAGIWGYRRGRAKGRVL